MEKIFVSTTIELIDLDVPGEQAADIVKKWINENYKDEKTETDCDYPEIQSQVRVLMEEHIRLERKFEGEQHTRLTEIVVSATHEMYNLGMTKEQIKAKIANWVSGKFDYF